MTRDEKESAINRPARQAKQAKQLYLCRLISRYPNDQDLDLPQVDGTRAREWSNPASLPGFYYENLIKRFGVLHLGKNRSLESLRNNINALI